MLLRNRTLITRHLPLVLAVLCALPVANAEGGTYTVSSCKTADSAKAALDWVVQSRWGDHFAGNGCPQGYQWMDLPGTREHTADDYARFSFRAPPDTQIEKYTLWRSVQLTSPYRYHFVEVSGDENAVVRETCFADQACTSKGDWRQPFPDGNVVQSSAPDGLTGLDFVIFCGLDDGVGTNCPTGAPAANFQLHRADITIADHSQPVFALPPTGPLVDPRTVQTGEQQAFVWATDRGGGVRDVLVEVDGQVVQRTPIDDNDGRCREPFDFARPCKPEARGTVSFNTASLSDGSHRLRLLVTDATGTNVAAWGPVEIQTANAQCNPEPRSPSLQMRASFSGRKGSATRTVGYGSQARIAGRLTTPDGAPVAGVPLCVAERNDADLSSLRATATLTTDANGRFRYAVPRGPSRELYFVARVPGGAVTASVQVRVRAPVDLRPSRRNLRNGDAVVLSGRLPGRPVPRRGVVVELQARRTGGWQTFGTARSTHRGRFRFTYEFSRTHGVQRYQLRARVARQGSYPYATGVSRPITVTVRG